MPSSEMPIYFINPDNRKHRHDQWQQIVKDDEAWWNRLQSPNGSSDQNGAVTRQSAGASSDWDASKSAVLGMATKYHLDTYESECLMLYSLLRFMTVYSFILYPTCQIGFVGSLRATGYSGAIILGIGDNLPADVIAYLKEQNVSVPQRNCLLCLG